MSSNRTGQLTSAVDGLYEAALRPELWRGALHEFSLACGADGLALLLFPGTSSVGIATEGLDPFADRFVAEGWIDRNDRARRILPLRPKGFVTDADLFDYDELDRVPLIAELLRPAGFKWFAGAISSGPDGTTFGLSLDRKEHRGFFTKAEVRELDAILVHVRRALEIAVTSERNKAAGYLEALDDQGKGGIVVGADARCLATNATANRLLGDGFSICDGRLRARDTHSDAQLQRLLSETTGKTGDVHTQRISRIALRRLNSWPVIASAIPLKNSARDIFAFGAAVIVLTDPLQRSTSDETLLQSAFGLTPTEARLAVRLVGGETVIQIAAETGHREDTIRRHLASIFAKTGTKRQSDLVAMLGRIHG